MAEHLLSFGLNHEFGGHLNACCSRVPSTFLVQNMYRLQDSGSGKRPSSWQTKDDTSGAGVVASVVVVVVKVLGQTYPTVQRASVGLKFDPAGHRKVYSWNVKADVCRQYLYVWQSDCSGFGFGKRPDVEHTKEGSEVVGNSSVVVTMGVVLGFEVVVGSVDGSGVVVVGFEVVADSVEDSVVDDVTALGQVYTAVVTQLLLDQLKMLVPGHFITVATRFPSISTEHK